MKLDFKGDASLFATEISRLLGIAPILMMMGAVMMLIVAVFTVQDFVKEGGKEKRSMELPQFSLKKLPAGKKIYEDFAVVLGRLSPDVSVKVEKEGLRISITDAGKYPEFMYVLNSIQGVSENVVWSAKEICLAACGGGAASFALINGYTEKVEVKLRGKGNE